ncbi:MAG: BamA/TamA family outer membrane protein [Bacteroidota bacterium]
MMSLRKITLFMGVLIFPALLVVTACSAQTDSLPNIIPRKGLPVNIIAKKNHLLVLPVIARSIETSWSFGTAVSGTFHINKKDSTARTSNLQSLVLYSLKKQFIAAVNGTIYFPGEKFILSTQLSYSFFPDKFWGTGRIAPDSNAESYNFKQFYIYLHGQRSVANHLYVGVIYEYQRLFKVNYIPGGLFDKENIPGRTSYHISGLGASFTYDTRNDAFAPDKGVFLQGYFNHFAPLFGSDFKYTNYVVDVRSFIKTYKKQVLALQAYAFLNSGMVPLRSLASFGGANSMRGYYDGRYRDKDQVVLQAEYRVPVYKRFGAVLFGGVGNVGHASDYLTVNELKYSYGGGIRVALTKSEKLNLRLDYGIARGFKSKGLYFQLGEAF